MPKLMPPHKGIYALVIGIFLIGCAGFIIVEQFLNNIFVTKPISIAFVIYFVVRGGLSLLKYFRTRRMKAEDVSEPPTP